MEGLLMLVLLVPAVIIILLVANHSKLGSLSGEIKDLKRELLNQRKTLENLGNAPTAHKAEGAIKTPPTAVVKPPIIQVPEKTTPAQKERDVPPPTPPKVVVQRPANEPRKRVIRKVSKPAKEPLLDRWFKNNPDFEKFIGENLMNKIGIAVFVIGIALFLKLAIDREYIDEVGRVIVGFLSGGILLFFAHRLRESFRAFSSVLIGGGISIFYFTTWFAYHEYGLLGQTATFAIMVGITALAVAFSLLYDRKELAILSLLGGFATPFLASSGSGNYVVLFTYLTILNAGMLLIAERKKWGAINVLSLVLTWLVFGLWVIGDYSGFVIRPIPQAMLFASIFFLIFFAMNMRYSLKHRKSLNYIHYVLILANTGAFFGLGIAILQYAELKMTGLLTACLGLFYLVNVYVFQRTRQIQKNTFYLLIGLVLTFVSLVAPVQLEGNHITLFWAAELVLLMWLAHKSGLSILIRSALLIASFMIVSWVMDLNSVYTLYGTNDLWPILNKGFLTSIAVIVSVFFARQFMMRSTVESLLPGLSKAQAKPLWNSLLIAMTFIGGLLEVNHQFASFFEDPGRIIANAIYCLTFALAIEHYLRNKNELLRRAIFGVLVLALIYSVTGGYWSAKNGLTQFVVHKRADALLFHSVFLLLLGYAIYRVSQLARALFPRNSKPWQTYLWVVCAYLVVLVSQQLDLAMVGLLDCSEQGTYSCLPNYRKVGYPILWGIGSFLFMFYGMRTKLKTVRLVALALFGITLVKLFLFDIQGASESGRVVAFILLGALLLVVSFMYQKLKGLLIDGNENKDEK